ncbi:hypothetical protein Hdeb2414_s0009g00324911 [Helianthus debilis subsp. tardiflorus]
MQMVDWKHAASVVTADGNSALEYTGMVDAFRKTFVMKVLEPCIKAWFRTRSRFCFRKQVVPSIAIAFVSYEVVKDLLGVEMRISD